LDALEVADEGDDLFSAARVGLALERVEEGEQARVGSIAAAAHLLSGHRACTCSAKGCAS
jgi:hypothetical protein